jgi:predicted enzyme related to lactoylglutathione lyase
MSGRGRGNNEEDIPMTSNAVGWFEIYVQDMQRARKFYESVFMVRLERLNSPVIEMWAFPMTADKPGAAGALVNMKGFPSGGNSVLMYFRCEDCAVEAARVAEAGGRIQRDKFSIGEYGFVVLVHDSEGNMIGLHSMK